MAFCNLLITFPLTMSSKDYILTSRTESKNRGGQNAEHVH
uniref:Uncharacterized protein n=1 Tax=Siphoviridae sp. ct8Hx23 TaxID=2825360 RepID=A0A8S5P932_9CAUD|nr:MAG TPA: hypothetical protein [Siphoviridae sp. ct8Hx23]